MKSITLAIILVILISFESAPQILFNDEFNGTTLDSRWTYLSQNPSSTMQVAGGELLLHASAQNGGTVWNTAPRIFQPVDPMNQNWTIETKLRYAPTNNYSGAGFALWGSNDLNDLNGSLNGIRRAYNTSGNVVHNWAPGFPQLPFTDTITYLKVERSPDGIRSWYSNNPSNWYYAGAMANQPVYYVGLWTSRNPTDGITTVDSWAHFDYFRVTTTSGVGEAILQPDFICYPNPVSNKLVVQCSEGFEDGGQLIVYDALGKVAMQQVFNSRINDRLELDVSSFTAGVYIIRIGSLVQKFQVK